MTAYETICHAIENEVSIEAMYDGYHRILCPHAVGTASDGRINVHSVQTGGSTSSGPIGPIIEHNWKCMKVDKLLCVSLHKDPWQTAHNHSVPASCIKHKHVEVNY